MNALCALNAKVEELVDGPVLGAGKVDGPRDQASGVVDGGVESDEHFDLGVSANNRSH